MTNTRRRPNRSASFPACEHERGERQRVPRHDPLELGQPGPELTLDRGQRHVHHRVVEHDHEQAEADGRERPPLAVLGGDEALSHAGSPVAGTASNRVWIPGTSDPGDSPSRVRGTPAASCRPGAAPRRAGRNRVASRTSAVSKIGNPAMTVRMALMRPRMQAPVVASNPFTRTADRLARSRASGVPADEARASPSALSPRGLFGVEQNAHDELRPAFSGSSSR